MQAPMQASQALLTSRGPKPLGLCRAGGRNRQRLRPCTSPSSTTTPAQRAPGLRTYVPCSAHAVARCADTALPAETLEQHATGGSQQAGQQWAQASRLAALAACGIAIACFAPAMAQAAATTAGASSEGGSFVSVVVSFVLHLDKHLSDMIATHGTATYAILWGIVFCETGLVLTPFLPGDSLLFAAGAFAGMGKLSVPLLMAVFISSAILGDAVNYAIGNKLGRWALERKMIKEQYIKQTRTFYTKYGGKTVVLARFVPIVRTFAPFVAGIGSMKYSSFALYNVAGAVLWSVLFVGAGFFFGNLPVVQHNFTLVVLAIVAVSVLPVVFEVMAARREAAQEGNGGDTLNSAL